VSALQKASLLHHAVAWQQLEVQNLEEHLLGIFFWVSVIKLCDMIFSLKAAFVGDIG